MLISSVSISRVFSQSAEVEIGEGIVDVMRAPTLTAEDAERAEKDRVTVAPRSGLRREC
jgi:hypothetical protein